MRGFKVLLVSLTMLPALCAPALAQSAAGQYGEDVRQQGCPPGAAAAGSELGTAEEQVNADVGAGACDAAENASQGTDAVNDALTGTVPPAGAAGPSSATPQSAEDKDSADGSVAAKSIEAAGGEGAASAGAPSGEEGKAAASITKLPETGGVSTAPLGWGALLLASGLLVRRVGAG